MPGAVPLRRTKHRLSVGARAELETCGPSYLVLRPFHAVYLGPQLLEDDISCGKGLADELFGTLVGVYLGQDLNERLPVLVKLLHAVEDIDRKKVSTC
jgi:hypothetical protein